MCNTPQPPTSALWHPQEEARLRALEALPDDTEQQPALSALVSGLRLALGVESAFISLVGRERVQFVARANIPLTEAPRSATMCAHTVLSEGPLIVSNATQDERFRDTPLVVESPNIRLYAGIPLHGPGGLPIGALCVADSQPRSLSVAQIAALSTMASAAEAMLCAKRPAPPRTLSLQDRITARCREAAKKNALIDVIIIRLRGLTTLESTLGRHLYERAMAALRDRLRQISQELALVQMSSSELLLLTGPLSTPLIGRAVASVANDRLRAPLDIDGVIVAFTGAVGVSQSEDGLSADELLSRAQQASQEAERCELHTPCFFNTALQEALQQRQRIATHLQGAASRGEMWMVYQPKVCPYAARIDSVEALLRWTSPELGSVRPDQFILLAEQSGLIIRLGQWLLRQACHDAARWHREGFTTRVAVNVSGVQLKQRDFAEQVAVALVDTELPPEMLEIELTESAIIDFPHQTRQTLLALRELGVRIALDDFGTGQSSLSLLRQMPIDTVKIDKSFVRNIDTNSDDTAMFLAVARMLHELGMETVVEGVETTKQLEIVRMARCTLVQGWLYSRALVWDDLLAYFRQKPPQL